MYSQIIEAQTKGKNWISSSQEKYFVWLSNFILLERIFSFIYSQAADGGLEFSVLNDGDPTASPSESKPTNTGKLLKIQNSSRTRVEHLIRTRFELPPSNTWMNYYTCSQDTLFHFSFAKNEKKILLNDYIIYIQWVDWNMEEVTEIFASPPPNFKSTVWNKRCIRKAHRVQI